MEAVAEQGKESDGQIGPGPDRPEPAERNSYNFV